MGKKICQVGKIEQPNLGFGIGNWGQKHHTLDRSLSVMNFDFGLTDKIIADNGIFNGLDLENLYKVPSMFNF